LQIGETETVGTAESRLHWLLHLLRRGLIEKVALFCLGKLFLADSYKKRNFLKPFTLSRDHDLMTSAFRFSPPYPAMPLLKRETGPAIEIAGPVSLLTEPA
jgi:hypothetical protein